MPTEMYAPSLPLFFTASSNLISLVFNSKDNFQVGTRCVVVADCDLRGEITIGSGMDGFFTTFSSKFAHFARFIRYRLTT